MINIYYNTFDKTRKFCPESTVPLEYRAEFRKESIPSFPIGNENYHSLARTRRFFKKRGIEFEVEKAVRCEDFIKQHQKEVDDS